MMPWSCKHFFCDLSSAAGRRKAQWICYSNSSTTLSVLYIVLVHIRRRLTAPVERDAKEHQPAFLACMGLQRGVGNPYLSGYRFRIFGSRRCSSPCRNNRDRTCTRIGRTLHYLGCSLAHARVWPYYNTSVLLKIHAVTQPV